MVLKALINLCIFASFFLSSCVVTLLHSGHYSAPSSVLLENFSWEFSAGICRGNLPLKFAGAACRENFPWQFAARICCGNLMQEFAGYLPCLFAVGFLCMWANLVYMETNFFILYMSKIFLFVRFSLLTVAFSVIAVAVMGHRNKPIRFSFIIKFYSNLSNWSKFDQTKSSNILNR